MVVDNVTVPIVKANIARNVAEVEFCYNNPVANGVDDRARAIKALKGIVGNCLTY